MVLRWVEAIGRHLPGWYFYVDIWEGLSWTTHPQLIRSISPYWIVHTEGDIRSLEELKTKMDLLSLEISIFLYSASQYILQSSYSQDT